MTSAKNHNPRRKQKYTNNFHKVEKHRIERKLKHKMDNPNDKQ